MKNMFKLIGIIALVAIIGFTMIVCDNGGGGGGGRSYSGSGGTGSGGKSPNNPGTGPSNGPNGPTVGSGTYSGKDVLGNSYSLAVGSSARAALKGDNFTMTVKSRDGKNRYVRGTVKEINADGTLLLETEGVEFTTVVGSGTLNSVAGVGSEMPEIPFTGDPINGSNTLTPRTFDGINLRATRWETLYDSGYYGRGQHWGSDRSVLLRDFPTNVSSLQQNNSGRYTITVSGKSDKDLGFIAIEVQGLTDSDKWDWISGYTHNGTVSAGSSFSFTGNLVIDKTFNLLSYKEIILQFTNVAYTEFEENSSWNTDNGWKIPEDVPDGQIMATISNLKIALKDTSRAAFKGNMDDFTYGIREDGWSAAYQQAMWKLTPQNIADAKKTGAKFEFAMTGLNGNYPVDWDFLDTENIALGFAWQDPVRGLWWQDQTTISNHAESSPGNWYYVVDDGVEWNFWQKKIRIDLATVIKDNRFKNATELNFIVGYWWKGNGETECIDELGISGANIVPPPPPSSGNMGNWYYGYEENGVTFEYKQAVWQLSQTVSETAQTHGAKLEVVFSRDLDVASSGIILVWQGADINRWWPTPAEAGTDNVNLYLVNNGTLKSGVTYDPAAKKLTVVLDQALETYNGSGTSGKFTDASKVNLIIHAWWGVNTKIDELGIVSANIVSN